MEKKLREKKLVEERELLLGKEKEKKNEEYDRKLQYYEERVKVMNEEYKREQLLMRNKTANVRIQHRRASDGLVGVNFPFEDYHEDIEVMVDDRAFAVEDAFEWNEAGDEEIYQGLPIIRDRLHYSFIWDRYGEVNIDTMAVMEAGIRIDPTNKNLNLKEEIKKLVQKDAVALK